MSKCPQCSRPAPCGNPKCNSAAVAGDGNAQETSFSITGIDTGQITISGLVKKANIESLIEQLNKATTLTSLDFSKSTFQDNEVEITMVDELFAREQNPQQPVTVTGNEQIQNLLSKKRESSAENEPATTTHRTPFSITPTRP